MARRPHFAIGTALALFSLSAASADPTEAQKRAEAADVAAFIASQAGSAELTDPATGRTDDQAQLFLDRLTALASKLEADLRAGAGREDTRETYRQMRRVRLALIDHAMTSDTTLPTAAEALLFDEMLAELSRYHRGE